MPVNDTAQTIPVLASLDLAESQKFYCEKLGFDAIVYEEEKYLIVHRDAMEIHFWKADDRIFPEHTSCYIRGGQISSLYDEYRARHVPGLSEFQLRPWDMKEFYIHDPHGNLLRFGASPEVLDRAKA